MNNRYKVEMRNTLEKCKNLMNDKQNKAGVTQADKAIRTLERSRKHRNPTIKEEEELALRQMISGIIPEWKEANDREKEETIAMMKSWTGEMMYRARIQMKVWIGKKNEHRAKVQQRWENRGKYYVQNFCEMEKSDRL
eukprot:6214177-Pleurochrysis_carterae.AAC.3